MRLVILESSSAVAEWSAKYVMKRINDFKPGPDKYFVLGLPTGGYCCRIHVPSTFSMLIR